MGWLFIAALNGGIGVINTGLYFSIKDAWAGLIIIVGLNIFAFISAFGFFLEKLVKEKQNDNLQP